MIELSLHHQFLLSADGSVHRDGWERHRCGEHFLLVHPTLPVNRILDKDSQEVGCVLGWPIDPSGKLVQSQMRLPVQVSAQATEGLETSIYGLGGRFAVVISTPNLQRLYLDAGGTLGVVFSESSRLAGSTVTALVLHEPNHPLWSTAPGEFPDNKPNQYWPAGTTLDPEISRLLPNHYLDLSRWRAVRHYPRWPVEAVAEKDVPGCIEELVGVLRRNISGVLGSVQRLYMPLTAGRDSRMLLACSKAWTGNVDYVTFDYRPWRRQRSDRVDLDVSRRLAKRFGLHLQVVPISPSMPAGTERQYLHRVGFAGGAGKSRDFDWACREHLEMSAAWLTGFAGEVGRAFYWKPTDNETHRMSSSELLARLGLPASDRLQAAMRAWLDTLPVLPLSTLLDFAYLEHRLGCWAAPHLYGAAPFSINLTPFCHREIFDIMLRLPSPYRRSKALAGDVIAAAWPELLALPYNEYPGMRRFLGPSSWVGRSKQKARSAAKRMLGRG